MPRFTYFCTALLDEEGRSLPHEIDIPQIRLDRAEYQGPSRMGDTLSRPGEPPTHMWCEEHLGWAGIRPINVTPPMGGV